MNANFLHSVESVLSKHGDQLRGLIGRELTAVKVVWDLDDDSWFADEPVVLIFGDIQLEIVFWQLYELALNWNTIDMNQAPNWFGCYGDMNLEWRDCCHAGTTTAIGQTVSDLRLVELFSESKVSTRSDDAGNEDGIWWLHALEFQFTKATLTIFNALDENGITADRLTHERYRHKGIGSGLKTVDSLEHVKANPKMYSGKAKLDGATIAELILGDARVLGASDARVIRIGDWWVVAAGKDWLNAPCQYSVTPTDAFGRVVAFPESGINSVRHEILTAAFAKSVISISTSDRFVVSGQVEDADPIWAQLQTDGTIRAIAFRMER